MDICAVANASDKVLEELGLTKAGDRLNLVAYCKSLDINCSGNITSNEESNKKRRVLLDAFLSRKKSTKTSRNKPANREVSLQQDKQMNKIKTKKVILGWKHFRDEDNAYIVVVVVVVVVELYLSTLTPSTVADFHGGRVPENYFTCRI
jgi:hypothetical protein